MEPRRDGSDLGLPDGETPAALKALSSNDPILSTESSDPTLSATSSSGSRSCVATAAIFTVFMVAFLVAPGPSARPVFVFSLYVQASSAWPGKRCFAPLVRRVARVGQVELLRSPLACSIICLPTFWSSSLSSTEPALSRASVTPLMF